ncbi:MAG: TetR/AcrR family transcriptional regulator [Thermoleophilaceae bacterium]|nr:TetR/AcrR family transcriptional regulator [Thermoleophilaceae bacterium]
MDVGYIERREDHALELLAQDGFEALSVEAIARRAGISRVNVYRSFGNLQGLVPALLRREEAQVRQQLEALVPAEPGDRSPRLLLVTRSRAFVMAEPLTWRVALGGPRARRRHFRRTVARGAPISRRGYGHSSRRASKGSTRRLRTSTSICSRASS